MRPLEGRPATRAWGRRAALLACFLVAGQLSIASHLLLVRHVVCPLDGELVHPDGPDGHAHAQPRPQGDRLPDVSGRAGVETHDGHEHCILASHRRDRTAVLTGVLAFRAPPSAIAATVGADRAAASPRVAIHRIAPKQSPPA